MFECHKRPSSPPLDFTAIILNWNVVVFQEVLGLVDLREASQELLQLIAARFSTLGDPARIQILYALHEGERTVSELIERTGFRQAKVSKHLQLLHRDGFVARRKEGLNVYYWISDPDVFHLCDVICGRLQMDADRLQRTVRLERGDADEGSR